MIEITAAIMERNDRARMVTAGLIEEGWKGGGSEEVGEGRRKARRKVRDVF